MKIVMLCEFFHETLEYQENLLVKYYVKHGHAVTVITSTFESVFDYYADRHDRRALSKIYYHASAKIVRLQYRYNIANRLRAYTPIDQILEREAPDLIFVHDISLNFPECVRYVRLHSNCKMIMDYHADHSNSGKNWLSLRVLHGFVRKRFLDHARPYLSRIFPIVPASATFLNEVYGVPLEVMEVLPLGADVDRANAARLRRHDALLRLYGIGDGDLVIFTGGKLAPRKQTELLLRAVALLDSIRLHVLVVGESSREDITYFESLKAIASGCDRTHFVGWLDSDAIYEHLAISHIAVFPASQSILWQQAIATGLPLIVGDTGHQDIGYLNLFENIIVMKQEAITVERIADEVRGLAQHPARLLAMSKGALAVAKEQLDWNRLIDRTLRFNLPAVNRDAAQCADPSDAIETAYRE